MAMTMCPFCGTPLVPVGFWGVACRGCHASARAIRREATQRAESLDEHDGGVVEGEIVD